MRTFRQLRCFTPSELLLDAAATSVVLKFIFRPVDHPIIDSLPMSDRLRGFAQALLLEAIDASYQIGFIESLWKSTINPAGSVKKIMRDFAKDAASHWFKHATVHYLQHIRVYQFVVDLLANHFRKELVLWTYENFGNDRFGAWLTYRNPESGQLSIRG